MSGLGPTVSVVIRLARPAMELQVPIATAVLMDCICTVGIAGMSALKKLILIKPCFNAKAVNPNADSVLDQLLTIVPAVRPIWC